MIVPRIGTWTTKWGMMTSLKGCLSTTFQIFSTDVVVGFNQRYMLNEVQNCTFSPYLRIQTKKTFLEGNLLACIFNRL